jgi:hypothetical protein
MKQRALTTPEIMLIAGTRGALGFGLGLLVADKLERHARTVVGWTLVTVGALSTVPLLLDIFGKPAIVD